MDLPEVVREALNDESVAARVSLGGDDLLLVTPSRTLVYRGEGLLSDESVAEYPHGAERIEVDRGRRKSTVLLDYGLDGERRLELPTDRLEDALHPVLAGVLNSMGVTESGEAIKDTFLFSELTVVVTSERLVRHIGETVWDGEFEAYHYDDVTDLRFEEGDVATSVVVRLESGQDRFKVPNERAREFREQFIDAVIDHHGHETLESFREARTPPPEERSGTVDFGDGPDPLDADPPSGGRKTRADSDGTPDADSGDGSEPESEAESAADADAESDADAPTATIDRVDAGPDADADESTAADAESTAESRSVADAGSDDAAGTRAEMRVEDETFADSGFESAGTADATDLAAEMAALREAIEEQNDLLRRQADRVEQYGERLERHGERIERQSDLFEQLVDELRRGR